MIDSVEQPSDRPHVGLRECAERWLSVLHEFELVQAMSAAGLDPDGVPDPDSYPGEG